MTGRQSAKYAMYYAVKACLDKRSAVWSGLPAFAAAKVTMDTELDALVAAIARQQSTPVGATEAKRRARERALEALCRLAAALRAYDSIAEVGVLEKGEPSMYPAPMRRLSDDAFGGRGLRILQLARQHANGLLPLGIDAAAIDEADALLATWRAAASTKMKAAHNGRQGTQDVAAVIARIDDILKHRLDPLALVLAASDGEFYDVYRGCRGVRG